MPNFFQLKILTRLFAGFVIIGLIIVAGLLWQHQTQLEQSVADLKTSLAANTTTNEVKTELLTEEQNLNRLQASISALNNKVVQIDKPKKYGYESQLKFSLVQILEEATIPSQTIELACDLIEELTGVDQISSTDLADILANLTELAEDTHIWLFENQYAQVAPLSDIIDLSLAGNLDIYKAVVTIVTDRFDRSILQHPNVSALIGYFLIKLALVDVGDIGPRTQHAIKELFTNPLWSPVINKLDKPEKVVLKKLKEEMTTRSGKK